MNRAEADEHLFQKQAALCDEIAQRLRECTDMESVQKIAELLDMGNFVQAAIKDGERELAQGVPIIRKSILDKVRHSVRTQVAQFLLEEASKAPTRGERRLVESLAERVKPE